MAKETGISLVQMYLDWESDSYPAIAIWGSFLGEASDNTSNWSPSFISLTAREDTVTSASSLAVRLMEDGEEIPFGPCNSCGRTGKGYRIGFLCDSCRPLEQEMVNRYHSFEKDLSLSLLKATEMELRLRLEHSKRFSGGIFDYGHAIWMERLESLLTLLRSDPVKRVELEVRRILSSGELLETAACESAPGLDLAWKSVTVGRTKPCISCESCARFRNSQLCLYCMTQEKVYSSRISHTYTTLRNRVGWTSMDIRNFLLTL